jgi:hypothetical protein
MFLAVGEMLEGDSADMCAHADGGMSEGSSVCRNGSEDPLRYERKLLNYLIDQYYTCKLMIQLWDVLSEKSLNS